MFKQLKPLLVLFLLSLSTLLAQDSPPEDNIPSYFPKASKKVFYTTTRAKGGALKKDLLKHLKSVFRVECLVESGTYVGDSSLVAADVFSEVHTVELSDELYNRATQRFNKTKNIKVYQGDSSKVFETLLPTIQKRILFYLDGHYSGGISAKGPDVSPVLKEIAAIKKAQKENSLILIDDLRLFQPSFYPEKIKNTPLEGYPNLKDVIVALIDLNPNYQICFLADAIFAFPKEANVTVTPLVNACALHRLSSDFAISEDLLLAADKTISSAQGKEKSALMDYYNVFANFEITNGFRSYAALWYGLLLMKEKKEEAFAIIDKAASQSLPGWRANKVLSLYW